MGEPKESRSHSGVPVCHWATFGFVALEQGRRGPLVDDRSQLPADVHGISDPRVEPVSPPRWILVSRISGQKHSATCVAVDQQHACPPGIGSQHRDRHVGADQVTDEAFGIGVAGFGVDALGDTPPRVLQVKPTHQTGLLGIQDPVVHGGPVSHLSGKVG